MTTSSERIPDDIDRIATILTRARYEDDWSMYRSIALALHARDKRAAEIVRTWGQDDECVQPMFGPLVSAILSPTPAVSSPGCGTSEAPASASYSSSGIPTHDCFGNKIPTPSEWFAKQETLDSAGGNGPMPSAEAAGDEASRPTVSAHPIPPGPHLSSAADGQPGIPSSAAGGAKMEGPCRAYPGRGDTLSRHSSTKAEQAVTYSSSGKGSEVREGGYAPEPSSAGNLSYLLTAPAESAPEGISAPIHHSSRPSSSATIAGEANPSHVSPAPVSGDA